MKKINVGVIGLGVGRQHAISYRNNPFVDKIYISDFNKILGKKVAKEINAESYFYNWRDMLSVNLDAVSICSYDDYHAEQMLCFANEGVSIMIEKPMCVNREELMKIKNSKSLKKVLIQCNFILREYPRFKKIKSLVLSKKFGNIFCIEISYMHFIEKKITLGWRKNIVNYSTLLGGGIHLLDQLFYIFQDIKINSFVGFSNKIATKNSDFLYNDTYLNLLKLDSGAIVRLFSSYSTKRPKLHAINIYGTKGSLEHRDDGLYIYKDDNLKNIKKYDIIYPGVGKGGKINSFIEDVKKFKLKKKFNSERNYLIKLHKVCLDLIENSNKV